jgi:hypothetical protein
MANSPTATTGQKCACSPDDENHTQTTRAQKIYESQRCPKAKDYDDLTQEILTQKTACEQVEVKLQIMPELVKMV